MTGLRPRRTAHRGSVLASGLAIDTRMVAEPQARERILRLSPHGVDAFRVGTVLVARFREPARLRTAAAGGAPLVRYGRLLSAAPLDVDEQGALGAFEETLVLVAGGLACAAPLNDETRVDISEWIDVSGFRVIADLRPLGGVLSEPRARIAEPVGTVRDSFGVGPLKGEAVEAIEALARRGSTRGGHATARQTWLGRAVAGFWQIARRQRSAAREASGVGRAGARSAIKIAGERSSRLSGMRAAFRDFFARALWSSKMARLIGRRHVEYLLRVLDMLDAQDFDNALRHAVPLNGELDSALRAPPLGLPTARTDLAITPSRPTAGTSLGLGGELFELLRQRYRRAFERLDAMGEIEKAAFVLAELLNASEEAVSYLERHGRLRLAAEIAEARKLPPGLVIRQWFLAGDRARAVHVARQTGAFADAVVRLEASHKEEGRILRLLWADSLASGGAYAAAVDAAWPIEEARSLIHAWIDRAIAIGGPVGARMLARKVRLAPGEFSDVRDRVLEMLQREAEGDGLAARAFAHELAADPPTAETCVLARPTVRRLLREAEDKEVEHLVDKLLKITEPVFAADVRGRQPKHGSVGSSDLRSAPLRSRPTPLDLRRVFADRGAIPVTDAAELPDGRMLVAVGELGVWLLSRDGKVITRFAEPTHRIVISDHGDRAILLAKRGEIFRASRLDVLARRVQHWCDARFSQFAADFDGSTWFVARGDTLYAVDATATRWEHLWKVDERGADVRAIQRDARWASALLVRSESGGEVWTFELPSITLRRRQPLEKDHAAVAGAAVAPHGMLVGWRIGVPRLTSGSGELERDDGAVRAIVVDIDGRRKNLPVTASGSLQNLTATNEWIVLPVPDQRGTVFHLVDSKDLAVRARIALEGAEWTADIRIQGDRLIIFDGYGRVIVLSLSSGAVLREHRLA